VSQWNWNNNGLANYFRYLTNTLELTISSFDKKLSIDLICIEIAKLAEYLQNGQLKLGVGVKGT
jgi:glutaminase